VSQACAPDRPPCACVIHQCDSLDGMSAAHHCSPQSNAGRTPAAALSSYCGSFGRQHRARTWASPSWECHERSVKLRLWCVPKRIGAKHRMPCELPCSRICSSSQFMGMLVRLKQFGGARDSSRIRSLVKRKCWADHDPITSTNALRRLSFDLAK
jgi:hypothetical protein